MAVARATGLRRRVRCTMARGAGAARLSGAACSSSCGDSRDNVALLAIAPANARDICTKHVILSELPKGCIGSSVGLSYRHTGMLLCQLEATFRHDMSMSATVCTCVAALM